MSGFGLTSAAPPWGYSTANPYSPYLGQGLTSCAAGTGFNTPAIGFGDNHADFGSTSTVSSSECHQINVNPLIAISSFFRGTLTCILLQSSPSRRGA